MKQLTIDFIRGMAITLSLGSLFVFGGTGCSHAANSSMGFGTGGDGLTSTYTGGNPYTPVNPTAPINAQNGTNSGTGGSGANGTFTLWDQNGALNMLKGINPINPAQSSVGSDLDKGIDGLLQQASNNGAAAVEQDCSQYSSGSDALAHGCYNRLMLGGDILKQCSAKMDQYKPNPGETMLGTYQASCPPLAGYTNGKLAINVTGNYNSFGTDFNFPKVMKMSGVAVTGNSSLVFNKKAGAGSVAFSLTDSPTAASGTLNIQNSAAKYACNTNVSQTSSNNPIPARTAQGMKSLSDCYRKAMLLMSPLFDTMFNNMQGTNGQPNPAMYLMMSAMNLGDN